MRNQWTLTAVLICVLLGPWILSAESSKSRVSEEVLQGMASDDQSRRVEELARLITNLERQMNRLDDRFEKLDRDLKEIKRKV